MNLKEKINEDLKNAMKSGETEKRDTLRMIGSMIKNAEIEKGKKESGLNDEEVVEVLARAVKQRKDSAEQYKAGNRPDLAEKEEKEIEIISTYLPEQMSEEEIAQAVKEVIGGLNLEGKADIGKVMGPVMGKLKGKADGNLVREIVQKELNSLGE